MNLQLLCDTLRPLLLKFYQTKRTIADANTFIQSSSELEIDKELLNLFTILSVDSAKDTNMFSKELKDISRKLLIGILQYPNNKDSFDLESVIIEYKKQVAAVSKTILGQQIDERCQTLEKRYWNRLLEDLNMEYYDDLLKILLGFRTNLLEALDGSGYAKDTVMEYMDLEFIKLNLYQKSYRFIGLFQFIFDFVQSRLHPVLKETFIKLCSDFTESLEDIESNQSVVLTLQFITNHVIDFLYMDVEETVKDITEP